MFIHRQVSLGDLSLDLSEGFETAACLFLSDIEFLLVESAWRCAVLSVATFYIFSRELPSWRSANLYLGVGRLHTGPLVTDIELAELMGHTEVRTTHRYARLTHRLTQ